MGKDPIKNGKRTYNLIEFTYFIVVWLLQYDKLIVLC